MSFKDSLKKLFGSSDQTPQQTPVQPVAPIMETPAEEAPTMPAVEEAVEEAPLDEAPAAE